MGFGSTETFDSEGAAYKRYPQIVISLKNEMKKFRDLGIAPIAAAGQFGAPFAAGLAHRRRPATTAATRHRPAPEHRRTTTPRTPASATSTGSPCRRSSTRSSRSPGRTRSRSPPARARPRPTRPDRQPVGISGHQSARSSSSATRRILGGGAVGHGHRRDRQRHRRRAPTSLPGLLANADSTQYVDRILGVGQPQRHDRLRRPGDRRPDLPPDLRRDRPPRPATGHDHRRGQDNTDHNTFNDAGTSLSAAEVTGAFALVSSALSYWSNLAKTGVHRRRLPDPAGRRPLP